MGRREAMNNRIANDLIRYAELVEDGALISPEEMNCASVMRLAAEYLVQPEQSPTCGEPVAWEYKALYIPNPQFDDGMRVTRDLRVAQVNGEPNTIKPLLYTTPQPVAEPHKRKPLTREQRIQIVKDNTVQGYHGDYFDAWGIIDDVEAAHGIKEAVYE